MDTNSSFSGASGDKVVYQTLVLKALSADGRALAISAGSADEDNTVYVRTLNYADDLQFWQILPTRNGDGFALVNKRKTKCIVRTGTNQGSHLILMGVDQIAINDLAVWRNDNVSGTYNAINSYADWEQKINVPGNGPYRDGQALVTWGWSGGASNELWAKVPDATQIKVKSIDFNLPVGNVQDQEPLVASTQTVTNTTNQEQTQTVKFKFTESHSYSFTQERGLKISESIEFKAGLPLVGESKVAIKVEGSWKFSSTQEETDESEASLEVPVTIPPQTAIRVSAFMLRARLDVPYNATLTITYADGVVSEQNTSGFFTGVNGYNVVTKFEQLGQVAGDVKRTPFDRFRDGSVTVPPLNTEALKRELTSVN